MVFLYLVYSPKEYVPEVEAIFQMLTNCQLVWMVKEYGAQSDHSHLNCVYQTTVRPDNLRRQAYRKVNIEPSEQRHLIHVKKVSSLPGVAAYLVKEDAHVVLYEHPAYKILDYVSQYDESQSKMDKSLRQTSTMVCITESWLISMALEYFEDVPVSSQAFRSWQEVLVRRRIYVSRVSWRRVYNYVSLFYGEADPVEFPQLHEI